MKLGFHSEKFIFVSLLNYKNVFNGYFINEPSNVIIYAKWHGVVVDCVSGDNIIWW